MKNRLIILFVLLLCVNFITQAQELKFTSATPLIVKKGTEDKNISITFMLDSAKKKCVMGFKVDEEQSSAAQGKDYTIITKSIDTLTKDNQYKGTVDISIKAQKFNNTRRELYINFYYKNEKAKDVTKQYVIYIFDMNDGSADAPQYTQEENKVNKHLSFNVFTGGTFDYADQIKMFQKIGFEISITANDLFGKDRRFGFFLGASNFQNVTIDSSNANVRLQRIRVDTGAYINGKTQYKENTFIDHKKITSNQLSYYINPTFRLNKTRSDLVNFYLSFRAEILQVSTQIQFLTDTISTETTNRPLGSSPVFQSGKGFLLQKATNIVTNDFYSVGLPVFLTSKEKFDLYIDPNLGFTSYTYTSFVLNANNTSLQKFTTIKFRTFGLFKFRVTEQFSGLNITFGGEIRDIFSTYTPTINAYIGVRANIAKWFSK